MREKLIELIKDIVVPYFAEEIADHLLVNGVTLGKDTDVPTKWTKTADELPKHKQPVLCYCQLGMYEVLYFDHEEWAWMREGTARDAYFRNFVIFWMLLPEEPEEES